MRQRPLGRYRYVRLRWRVLFTAIDAIGGVVFGVARALRRLLPVPAGIAKEHDDDLRRILLVQLDHLGDAIITTAILPALRRRYPRASIEVLAGPWNRAVFEAAAEVDRVEVSAVNRFARGSRARFAWIASLLWWAVRLRRRHYDLGIDVRGEFSLALLLWLAGVRRRIGWGSGGGGFLLSDRATSAWNRPEVDSRWALLKPLGIEPPDDASRWPAVKVSPSARRAIAGRLGKAGGPRVVLHIGAGSRAKQWPVEHWRELLRRILGEHRAAQRGQVHVFGQPSSEMATLIGRKMDQTPTAAQVVLVGGPSDRIIARRILGPRDWPRVVDLTGRLSIARLAAVLEAADVVVGADSGPAHLAAAVDTPVVALFSGTNRSRQWRPRGRRVVVLRHRVACGPCHRQECPRPDHPCMRGLTPATVAWEVAELLAGRVGACTHAATSGEL